jgi:hypothetical protein
MSQTQTAKLLALTVLLGVVGNVYSQNLEAVGKEKPLTISGGASLSQIFYTIFTVGTFHCLLLSLIRTQVFSSLSIGTV